MEYLINHIEYIAYTLMAIALLYIVYQILTKGFRGSLFQGKIVKTYGEFQTLRVSGMTNKIKIYEIENKSESTVGIEISGPFEITPIRLKKEDIPRLIELLKKTINET